jgi:hypothetical protein
MDPDAGAGHDVELVAGPQREPRRRLGLFALNLAVLAAALVGVFVLGARDDDAALPPDTTVPPSSTIAPTVEQLLANMPASPIDGRQSQRLPVAATPRSGLVDGQIVTALGKGFHPGERVGAVVCLAEAALEGVAACDLGTNGGFDHVTYAEASNEGFVHVDVAVPAMIVTPFSGPVDCRSGPERCLVALGAVSDYDRSGGAAIGFAEQPPFPEPIFTVSAPGPYLPDHVVDVVVTGMMWPREIEVQLCRGDHCIAVARGRVAPTATFAAPIALPWSFTTTDGTVVTCDADCELRVGYLALPETSDAPIPHALPLTFVPVDPAAPPAPAVPPTTPTAPPSTPPESTLPPDDMATLPAISVPPSTTAPA